MTSYRQMRRQGRRARRAGLQPVMVISAGSQFPAPAGVILARAAWRYRSELVPAFTTGAVLGAGWWAHLARPHWWPYLIVVSAVIAWALVVFGSRLGLAQFTEQVYAGVIVFAAGGWVALADRLGPLTPPLPQVLGVSALILAIPWWANRRRRARARVLRTLAAWPDISREIGLPGAAIQSASVDLWGWRARLRLAHGQTIADVAARIPVIESALGTFRGAVHVYPTRDDKANWCELRVLGTDPHAEAIGWPGPSAQSITQPVDLGPFADAEPCLVSFLHRHALFAGTSGSGKSCGLNVLMGTLAACDDVVIWAVDLKEGMELGPWAPCIDRLATTLDETAAMLADAAAILTTRAAMLSATGRRVWEPSPDMPALVVIVDEFADLIDAGSGAMSDTNAVANLGRAVAVTLVVATQHPTRTAMGQDAVRSQMDTRICFRVRERREVDLALGHGMLDAGWNAHTLKAPGKFLVSAPEHVVPRRALTYLVTDDDVAWTVARYADRRPHLDEVSRSAILPDAATGPGARPNADDSRSDSRESGNSAADPVPWYLTDPHGNAADSVAWYASSDAQSVPDNQGGYDTTPEGALWLALCTAPDEGADIAELMRLSGMTRHTLYRCLDQHAQAGRAIQVSPDRWRATATEDPR